MFKFISNKVGFILQSVIEGLDFFCLQTPLKHQKPTALSFGENEELELDVSDKLVKDHRR